jgi:hypothetical protein
MGDEADCIGDGGARRGRGADRITQKTPASVPLLKRMHLPLWLVELRLVRRKSPLPLDATLLGNKEEMLGQLRSARHLP